MKGSGEMGDSIWTWTTRICAVGTLAYLMLGVGFDKAPTWAFILTVGLFFGPDALKGNISILGVGAPKKNGNGNGK